MTAMMAETATRLFSTLCTDAVLAAAETGGLPQELWGAVEELGLPAMLADERHGGIGAAPRDAVAVLRTAGRHAVPLPLAETMLARWLLSRAGLEAPAGPLAVALGSDRKPWRIARGQGGAALSGEQAAVAWGASAAAVVAVAPAEGGVALGVLPPSRLRVEPGRNIAGEPRDRLAAQGAPLDASALLAGLDAEAVLRMAALLRAAMISGALENILDMSVRYVRDRVQFGRPLAKFQAVQQQLAVMAGAVAAASAITDAAASAVLRDDGMVMVAAARARLAAAIDTGAAVAHQVHGAMGFVREYPLHFSTRRLWGWRDEYGSAAEWRERLGRAFAGTPADALWPRLAAVGIGR
ncbi:acyl-CoA dehydrogenase family protein [Pigmentiphaga soli]|uniref:Acyl-CoA dehydrogenase family protein n=2 Tax=Pigmentiphaga soli TaxID=1007095 RepID=A0ABP8H9B8_9BURK